MSYDKNSTDGSNINTTYNFVTFKLRKIKATVHMLTRHASQKLSMQVKPHRMDEIVDLQQLFFP